jgi:hypothetical protein
MLHSGAPNSLACIQRVLAAPPAVKMRTAAEQSDLPQAGAEPKCIGFTSFSLQGVCPTTLI